MKTCGATPGGPSLDGIDVTTQTIIQGVVLRDGDDGVPNGTPVGNAHVRLLASHRVMDRRELHRRSSTYAPTATGTPTSEPYSVHDPS